MTYLTFHLWFTLPALALSGWLVRHRLQVEHWKWMAVLAVIVLVATTPWDNWAVHKGIWTFDWARTTPVAIPLGGVTWRLPAEEYAFFLIETVFVSFLTLFFLPKPVRKKKFSSEATTPQ